jgi:tetratricopeptide (TPR) repeat protein
VKYCHNCGYKLTLETEKFCPNCGQNLTQKSSDYDNKVSITDTGGDVYGTDVSGTGNIIGKEVGYTVQGNVINLQISGRVSNEVLQSLQKMIAVPTQVESAISGGGREYSNKEIKEKQEAAVEAKQQISQVLEDINKIAEKEGKGIQEIKAGDLHVSTKELSLNEIMLKGNEHYYKREYSEAISWYDKAIKIDPNLSQAWNNKGTAFGILEKYQEATECFEKALEIDPNDAKAWNNKGIVLDKLGKYQEAIEHYDKATEFEPNGAYAWYNKGSVLSILGKYQEAIEHYDKAIGIDPNYTNAWNNKGLAFDKLGKYQEALESYDKAIKIDPDHTVAWNGKGSALYQLGRYQEAIKSYDKALEIDPNLAVARKNRDRAYKQLGNPTFRKKNKILYI